MNRAFYLLAGLLVGSLAFSLAGASGIVYVFADSTIRTALPDGTAADRPAKAGDVFWRDATSHSVVNVGQTEAHALAIDLKQCKP